MTAVRHGPVDPPPRGDETFGRGGRAVGSDRGSQTVVHPDGDVPAGGSLTSILLAVGITVPAIVLRFSSVSLANWVEALFYGLAIVGAAFIL